MEKLTVNALISELQERGFVYSKLLMQYHMIWIIFVMNGISIPN